MLQIPWIVFFLLLYAMPAAFVCLPMVCRYRSIGWQWWELLLLFFPFGLWLFLITIDDGQKTLCNAVIEPFLCGLTAVMPILFRVVVSRYGRRPGPAYFAGLLISSAVVLIIYMFMPAIPE